MNAAQRRKWKRSALKPGTRVICEFRNHVGILTRRQGVISHKDGWGIMTVRVDLIDDHGFIHDWRCLPRDKIKVVNTP